MMTINDCIEKIIFTSTDLSLYLKDLKRLYQQCDFIRFLSVAEKSLRTGSDLLLCYRELVYSLYAMIPSLPQTVDVNNVLRDAMRITVEEVKEFDFPVYKISLPFLLPNKRKRDSYYKNAVTNTVGSAVKDFCNENRILPFEHDATVIYVSLFEADTNYFIDNDNKESSVIQNALNGSFLRDDRSISCHTIYYSKEIEAGAETQIYIVESKHDVEVYSKIKAENMSQTNAVHMSQTEEKQEYEV